MSKYETVYRVVYNKEYNDFNGELEYTILTYDFDRKKNKIRVKGFNDWHDKPDDCFYYKTYAEQELVTRCCEKLKQQLAYKDIEIEKVKQERDDYEKSFGQVSIEIAELSLKLHKEIDNLQQQLEEKGNEINIKNNKLNEKKKQLQNFQSEIIRLKANNKNLMSVIWKTKRERANKGRQVCQSQNESIKYKKLLNKSEQKQAQLAIQELEKVKNFVDGRTYCANYIKKRIKELKGEKDVED